MSAKDLKTFVPLDTDSVSLLRMALSENIHTPDESGRAMADMVDGKDWAGVSGRYAEGRKIIASSEESYDETKARRLWEVSEALVR